MKGNLELLELQQRDITRMVAIIISLLFYFFLVVGLMVALSYKSQLDNIQIQKKVERVERSLEIINLINKPGNEELKEITNTLFVDTTIYSVTKHQYYSHYLPEDELKIVQKSRIPYFE
jgi:hypothetical protein